MIDEEKLKELLRTSFATLVNHLWLPGIHNSDDVIKMLGRIDQRIEAANLTVDTGV